MRTSRKKLNIKRLIILIVIMCVFIACVCFAIITLVKSNKKDKSANKNTPQEKETTVKAINGSVGAQDATDAYDDYDQSLSDSNCPYLVKVNRAANCVTVYSKNENGDYVTPIKAMRCSTGKNIEDTPLGTFHTTAKYEWCLMVDGTYSQYAYRIHGGIMFHSVPNFEEDNSTLEYEEYNKLGSPASLGCVRLTVQDSKWLYDNCPQGTTVVIYDDAENPGPLGKPETITIPEDSDLNGWDPTDPDPANPWLLRSPVIYNATDVTLMVNSSTNLLKYIKAVDTCGNDISDKIGMTGNYDFSKPGIYNITFTVTDILGKSTSATINVTISDQITKEILPIEQYPDTNKSENVTKNSNDDDDNNSNNHQNNYNNDNDYNNYQNNAPQTEPVTQAPEPTTQWQEPQTEPQTDFN